MEPPLWQKVLPQGKGDQTTAPGSEHKRDKSDKGKDSVTRSFGKKKEVRAGAAPRGSVPRLLLLDHTGKNLGWHRVSEQLWARCQRSAREAGWRVGAAAGGAREPGRRGMH